MGQIPLAKSAELESITEGREERGSAFLDPGHALDATSLRLDLDGAWLTSCPPVPQVPAQMLESRIPVASQQPATLY